MIVIHQKVACDTFFFLHPLISCDVIKEATTNIGIVLLKIVFQFLHPLISCDVIKEATTNLV